METTIQKWGNSLGVRIPKEIVKRQSLRAGMRVIVGETKRDVVIKKAPVKKINLASLVRRITKKNCHRETDWGVAVGKEIW